MPKSFSPKRPVIKSYYAKSIGHDLDETPLLQRMYQARKDYVGAFGDNKPIIKDIQTKRDILVTCHAKLQREERHACEYIAVITLIVLDSSRFPASLQQVARIMRNSEYSCISCTPKNYIKPICKRIAKDLVKRKFYLSDDEVEKVHAFIDSDPKYKGVSIFAENELVACKVLDGLKRIVRAIEKDIRKLTEKMEVRAIKYYWENDV